MIPRAERWKKQSLLAVLDRSNCSSKYRQQYPGRRNIGLPEYQPMDVEASLHLVSIPTFDLFISIFSRFLDLPDWELSPPSRAVRSDHNLILVKSKQMPLNVPDLEPLQELSQTTTIAGPTITTSAIHGRGAGKDTLRCLGPGCSLPVLPAPSGSTAARELVRPDRACFLGYRRTLAARLLSPKRVVVDYDGIQADAVFTSVGGWPGVGLDLCRWSHLHRSFVEHDTRSGQRKVQVFERKR